MKDHKGDIRGFTQLSKAWYGRKALFDEDILEEITVGFYCPDGGTSGEFAIIWKNLPELMEYRWVPRLKAYDDGWSALYHFSDMLEKMAEVDNENIDPDSFAKMLEGLGIENMTRTEQEVVRERVANMDENTKLVSHEDMSPVDTNT